MPSIQTPSYFQPAPRVDESLAVDLCVYGATSGGIIAAIEAAGRGLSVALLHPGMHIGGLTTGGLGMTDIGNKDAVGGKAREFYERVGRHYGVDIDWRFEPHVAAGVFADWLREAAVQPRLGQYVDTCVTRDARIVSLTTLSGLTVSAAMFIDASYEGDLMARAGVSHTVGREDNSTYGETINGALIMALEGSPIDEGHQFEHAVDPYVVAGDPSSGLLPGIQPEGSYRRGAGDACVQAYNFRMCLTQREDIRVPFPKPEGYDASLYELLKRHLATGWDEAFRKFDAVRNGKTDTNNHGPFSTDNIGRNHAYPEAGYEERERIFQEHVRYQQGLMWTLANDSDIPARIREPMSKWGLCRDEFVSTGGWPHALYIREARRMVSEVVMTEHHCRAVETVDDPVALGAYNMDSHHCRRVIHQGRLWNEGDVQVRVPRPYGISYRSIVPRESECANLIVPFCLSASHVAFGSIRMEPVFMGIGQAAAIAAQLAIRGCNSVQQISYADLRRELDAVSLVAEWSEVVETAK
ncbi:MAG: FAD-dependent oxidoreductase [Verrucomicrobiota bacterium]